MKLIIEQHAFEISSAGALDDHLSDQLSEPWQVDILTVLAEWFGPSGSVPMTTSGSTGPPKRIKHSKSSMRQSASLTNTYFNLSQGKSALLCLPARFVAGRMMIIRALEAKLDLYAVEPRSNPLRSIEASIDFAAMTPHQVSRVLAETPEKLGLVRTLLLGGAPVSRELEEKLATLSTAGYVSYGMTETITHVALRQITPEEGDAVYQALPGIRFSTTNEHCLIIEADHLDDKHIMTQDVVTCLSPQRFVWLGRADRVINSGGVKIIPDLVESKLSAILKRRYFIGGVGHSEFGTVPILIIEGDPMSPGEMEELKLNMQNKLNKFETPKNIYFVRQFEETPTGKIIKNTKIYDV